MFGQGVVERPSMNMLLVFYMEYVLRVQNHHFKRKEIEKFVYDHIKEKNLTERTSLYPQ
jgi:hypothetical protein